VREWYCSSSGPSLWLQYSGRLYCSRSGTSFQLYSRMELARVLTYRCGLAGSVESCSASPHGLFFLYCGYLCGHFVFICNCMFLLLGGDPFVVSLREIDEVLGQDLFGAEWPSSPHMGR